MIAHCDMTLKFLVLETYSESQIIFTHSCLCNPAILACRQGGLSIHCVHTMYSQCSTLTSSCKHLQTIACMDVRTN